jgi:hypothetical protein
LTPSFLGAETDSESALFLNASPVTNAGPLKVPVGSNVLHVNRGDGLIGYRVEIEPESRPKLFLPELIRSDALSQVMTEEGQKELSRIINVSYESGTPVYVAHDDGIWRTASGIGSWEVLQAPARAARGGSGVGTMAWVASGLTAGALTGTVLALITALDSSGEIQGASTDYENAAKSGDFDAIDDAYERSIKFRNLRTAGFAGVGLGAALTTTGVILTVPMFR